MGRLVRDNELVSDQGFDYGSEESEEAADEESEADPEMNSEGAADEESAEDDS